MYKVSISVLEDIKKSLIASARPTESMRKSQDIGAFLKKRKRNAEKLIKLLEDNYGV